MRQPPPLIPDDTQPAVKTPMLRRRRRFYLLLWLLITVLSVTLVSTVGVLITSPELIGLQRGGDLTRTQAVFISTADALNLTAESIVATGQFNVDVAFANDSTAVALDNQRVVLQQASTQQALDFAATETAVANANAQQATRAALDFQGTQSAYDRLATQVELDYRGTQAALNRDATAAALGFATSPPDASELLPSPPPPPLFDEGFTTGLSAGLWDSSGATDWRLSDNGGIISAATPAWLLTSRADLRDYRMDVRLIPDSALPGFFYILLNVPVDAAAQGVMLEAFFDGTRISAVSLYPVTRTLIAGDTFLANQTILALTGVQVDVPLDNAAILLQMDVQRERVAVFINGRALLDVALESPLDPGAVGVYLPDGVQVDQVTVAPLG